MTKISLDEKILSLAFNYKKYAMELSNSVNGKYFTSDFQWLFSTLMYYFKDPNIKEIPTANMVREYLGDNSGDRIESFDKIKQLDVDPTEFTWLLSKLRLRYNNKLQGDVRDKVTQILIEQPASPERVEEVNKILKETVVNIDSVNRKTVYKEGTLRDSAEDRMKKYKYIKEHPETARGILSGFSTLDAITNGFHPGEFVLIAGDTGCQPARSKVLMANGVWKNVEDVAVGDEVLSPQYDGTVLSNKVTKTFVFHDRDIYTVKSNGKRQAISYRASHNHILPIFKPCNSGNNYHGYRLFEMSIDDYNEKSDDWKKKGRLFQAPAYDLPEKDFKLDPYIVGIMLGDGSLSGRPSVVSADREILDAFKTAGIATGKDVKDKRSTAISKNILGKDVQLMHEVLGYNKSHDKFIPKEYLCGSLKQRLELLAGLIDTDGTFSEFSSTSKQLAKDFKHLVCSVGGVATIRKRFTRYKKSGKKFPSYRVNYSFAEYRAPVRLKRKEQNERNMQWKNPRSRNFSVKYDTKGTVYGFSLDGKTQWYITDDFIVTHNTGKSILLQNIAVNAYLGKNDPLAPAESWDDSGSNILYFSLEMPKDTMERRIDACTSGVYSNHIRDGFLSEDDEAKYFHGLDFQRKYLKEFHIVDMPRDVTSREIELKYLEVCDTGFKPDLIVIDYMGIMNPTDPVGIDWQDLGKISAELHEFARVYEITVLTASQVNRTKDGQERYDTNRISRSGVIPTNANIILQIANRPDEELRTDMIIYIIKMRDGEKKHFGLSRNFAKMKVIDIVDDSFVDEDEDDII